MVDLQETSACLVEVSVRQYLYALFGVAWAYQFASLQCPVVIVPTNYYTTPTGHFDKMGISTIIWANHNLRASVKAMQSLTAQIYKDQSLVNIPDMVCVAAMD